MAGGVCETEAVIPSVTGWGAPGSYPKDALLAGQRAAAPGPEEDVGLAAGDDGVGVGGVELHGQDHLVCGLWRGVRRTALGQETGWGRGGGAARQLTASP